MPALAALCRHSDSGKRALEEIRQAIDVDGIKLIFSLASRHARLVSELLPTAAARSTGFSLPINTGPGAGYGNVTKGSIRGPGYTDWEAAMIRTFPIYRESTLDLRAEYLDVLSPSPGCLRRLEIPAHSAVLYKVEL